ncbi:MAG: hypothetical protein HC925_04525 [Coleofasciculaceae cyanobacterium SM2_3_26]|nr:hypothetical protein [Coleofasciculaceae cyanobacterium SM2_3_26]
MEANSQFRPYQIVCLHHERTALYAEVIQVLVDRQLCWVRPIALVGDDTEQDLRQGSDLLLPTCLFEPALDTEVMSLLSQLEVSDSILKFDGDRRQSLHAFVRQICQAHPHLFQTAESGIE